MFSQWDRTCCVYPFIFAQNRQGLHWQYPAKHSIYKMIKIQEINFPADCQVLNHDFYDYEPSESYDEEDSLNYLHEDLLQCKFPTESLIIDLGWYGDPLTNSGEFRIQVIQNENWDVPFNSLYSKSAEEVKEILTKILGYYSKAKPILEE